MSQYSTAQTLSSLLHAVQSYTLISPPLEKMLCTSRAQTHTPATHPSLAPAAAAPYPLLHAQRCGKPALGAPALDAGSLWHPLLQHVCCALLRQLRWQHAPQPACTFMRECRIVHVLVSGKHVWSHGCYEHLAVFSCSPTAFSRCRQQTQLATHKHTIILIHTT